MASRRGALIVLEGVDRAGKTTQGLRLVTALCDSGHQAEMLRFPERSTEIGRLLNSYLEKKTELEDHAVHLLFSANRWEQVIFPWIGANNPTWAFPNLTSSCSFSYNCWMLPRGASLVSSAMRLGLSRSRFCCVSSSS
ncbi:thymidylate kinase isoform X2 [Peromyscus leucopus]|uniref:thymidylate kinase isoform X2 n=1 Tax=Peromyscus leucopus TaxID=10041 RepID=UPI0018853196|nr:thymidylate kinase isoform X2 [Peromyscus leucopus]